MKEALDIHELARHLILNASFCNSVGLLHGKMGIVLFFVHYARYIDNDLYNNFAGELIDEVCDDMYLALPIDFENGLCGIGWGIKYLLENRFMEGEENEILSDIDTKIMERDPLRISDFSFKTGLSGILYYVLCRCSGNKGQKHFSFDENYLKNLFSAIQKINFIDDSKLPTNISLPMIKSILLFENDYAIETNILSSLFGLLPGNVDYIESLPLGIEKGLSGLGLRKIL